MCRSGKYEMRGGGGVEGSSHSTPALRPIMSNMLSVHCETLFHIVIKFS